MSPADLIPEVVHITHTGYF